MQLTGRGDPFPDVDGDDRPSIGPREASNSSRSRTRARDGTASSGRIRRSTDSVCGPTIPSGSSPTLRWNSRRAPSGGRRSRPPCRYRSRARSASAGSRGRRLHGTSVRGDTACGRRAASRLDELLPCPGRRGRRPAGAARLEPSDGGRGGRPEHAHRSSPSISAPSAVNLDWMSRPRAAVALAKDAHRPEVRGWRGAAATADPGWGDLLREVRVEVLEDRVLGPRAGDPRDLLPRLEQDQEGIDMTP